MHGFILPVCQNEAMDTWIKRLFLKRGVDEGVTYYRWVTGHYIEKNYLQHTVDNAQIKPTVPAWFCICFAWKLLRTAQWCNLNYCYLIARSSWALNAWSLQFCEINQLAKFLLCCVYNMCSLRDGIGLLFVLLLLLTHHNSLYSMYLCGN